MRNCLRCSNWLNCLYMYTYLVSIQHVLRQCKRNPQEKQTSLQHYSWRNNWLYYRYHESPCRTILRQSIAKTTCDVHQVSRRALHPYVKDDCDSSHSLQHRSSLGRHRHFVCWCSGKTNDGLLSLYDLVFVRPWSGLRFCHQTWQFSKRRGVVQRWDNAHRLRG